LSRIKSAITWFIAFALVTLCLVAGNWQLQKGLRLHDKNLLIAKNANSAPILDPSEYDAKSDQWKKFELSGEFNKNFRLLKNQYQDGQFGFHVLQQFNSKSLGLITVDRGWVAAGKDARTAPVVPDINISNDVIVVRLRSEILNTHLGGSFFALPNTRKTTSEIYFDLLSAKLNPPLTNLELPNLSTGPHFAYAFQWALFAIAILIGRKIWGVKLNGKAD
jgi:cytochrome oxidase assembly protein ShyY1